MLSPWRRVFLMAALAATPTHSFCQNVALDPARVDVARWEGWGCSLSWWAVFTESWPDAARKEACRRLFSRDPDALGLNIVRYNAGGTSVDADRTPYRLGGAVLATLDRDGSWHPERDAAQMDCLKLAKRFGADTFELFVNSPPYWMLKNGNTRGDDKGGENLDRARVGDYARWLVETARRTEETCGIRFASIAPFNEPSAWWWNGKTGNQEGCRLTWGAQAEILRQLRAVLDRSGRRCTIAASDENGAREAYATLEWLTKPDRGDWSGGGLDARTLQRINVHSYAGQDWQERLRTLAEQQGIPGLWMSEVSHREMEGAGFVPNDMRCALPLTRSIVGDIRRLRCRAWVHWQPIEPLQYCIWYHYTYGLMPAAADKDVEWNGKTYRPGEFVVTKAFHAVRQFTAFVRPGDRILASNDLRTLAALSPNGEQATVVVCNDTTNALSYSFDLSACGRMSGRVRAWRTSDDDALNCSPIPAPTAKDGRFTDALPPRSVTTYVVRLAPGGMARDRRAEQGLRGRSGRFGE